MDIKGKKNRLYFSENARSFINDRIAQYGQKQAHLEGLTRNPPECLKIILMVKRYRTMSKQDRRIKFMLCNALDYAIFDGDTPKEYLLKYIKGKCEVVERIYQKGNKFLVKDLGSSILISNEGTHVFRNVCSINYRISYYTKKNDWTE